MKKRINRLSLFSKAIIVLVFTIIFTAVLAFVYMSSEIKTIVTKQIKQGAGDALNIMNIQLQEKIIGGVSLLVDLRTDSGIQTALQSPPSSAANRESISQVIRSVIRNAYYAVEQPFQVAIISQYGDVYANWEMIDSGAVKALSEKYYSNASGSGLYTVLLKDIELSTSGNTMQSYYAQFMPLVGTKGENLGLAMALLPESNLYKTISFSQEEIHTTLLLSSDGNIISAYDKGVIGTSFSDYKNDNEISQAQVLYSDASARTQLRIVDIMSEKYIESQVVLIMQRMLGYAVLVISGILVAAYFIMHSITRPLKRLTKRMITSDYASFVNESIKATGKNEILLLERGFDIMDEDIKNLLQINEQKEKQKRDIEIAALQSQIQPHFLFNTLNTVRCAILNKHTQKAADLIVKLIALLRMTLVNGDELISLEKEIEAVNNYIDIIKMRHNTQFEFVTNISKDTKALNVPKLFLQPLVENCVAHGFKNMKNGAKICIDSFKDGTDWLILVKNNGEALREVIDLHGEHVQTSDNFSGIGIRNVNRRVKLYYGETAGLKIYTDENNITISELRMSWCEAVLISGGSL